jgi:hypothetical protein
MKRAVFVSSMTLLLAVITMSFVAFKQAPANVVFTQVVQLDAGQAGTESDSKGIAILRLTSDMKLHYRINIQKVDDGDMLMAAHIHYGAAGVNGGVAIGLASSENDFGVNKTIQLTATQYNLLLNDALYVNIHSMMYPNGSIRGQIR